MTPRSFPASTRAKCFWLLLIALLTTANIAALGGPQVLIKKGAVATNNPNAVFVPPLFPAGKWKPFGVSCPRFFPTITSGNLGGLINSDLYGIAANNSVTFAIAVQNTGNAPAYNVELAEIIPLDPLDRPACFETSGFCVRRGNGTAMPFITAPGGHGRTLIKLGAPLAPGLPFNPSGTNIVIITFNAKLLPQLHSPCCENRTQLTHFAASPGGPDLVGGNTGPAFSDSARLCRKHHP